MAPRSEAKGPGTRGEVVNGDARVGHWARQPRVGSGDGVRSVGRGGGRRVA